MPLAIRKPLLSVEVSSKWTAQLVFWTGEHNFVAVLLMIQIWKLLSCWVSTSLGIVEQLANKLCLKWQNFLTCCDAPVLLHCINTLYCLYPFLPVCLWSETGKISNCLLWHCAISSLSRQGYCNANCSPGKLICFGTSVVFVWMPLQYPQKAPKDCVFQTILIWTWVAS